MSSDMRYGSSSFSSPDYPFCALQFGMGFAAPICIASQVKRKHVSRRSIESKTRNKADEGRMNILS
jgi:hypothetical protein